VDPLTRLERLMLDDRFYDRSGRQISQTEHIALRKDLDYAVLGRDLAMSVYRVSTVWTGMSCMMFQTLVWIEGDGFESCDVEVLDWRYQTEHEAQAGHAAAVKQLNEGTDPRACVRPGAN